MSNHRNLLALGASASALVALAGFGIGAQIGFTGVAFPTYLSIMALVLLTSTVVGGLLTWSLLRQAHGEGGGAA